MRATREAHMKRLRNGAIPGVLLVLAIATACVCLSGQTHAASAAAASATGDSLREQLGAIGYLDRFEVVAPEDREKCGVTRFETDRASPGVNLFILRTPWSVVLLDMYGEPVHTMFPDGGAEGWHHVEPLSKGRFLAVHRNHAVLEFASDSSIRWRTELHAHHDVRLGLLGEIYTLGRRLRRVPRSGGAVFVVDDFIAELSPDGKIRREISLLEVFGDCPSLDHFDWKDLWLTRSLYLLRRFIPPQRRFRERYDLFHTNSIQVLDRDVEGLCERGDLLISVRNRDLIAVVDPDEERFVWSWGEGMLDKAHHATLLDDGNILIFDNGLSRGWSRVIELNPLTRRIEWEYVGDPPESFWSRTRGSAQRLPNGDTLITESDRGHVFEVTREGDIVWEYHTPLFQEGDDFVRSPIYRMMRYDESIFGQLDRPQSGAEKLPTHSPRATTPLASSSCRPTLRK